MQRWRTAAMRGFHAARSRCASVTLPPPVVAASSSAAAPSKVRLTVGVSDGSMRLDRWLRLNRVHAPVSLIEKLCRDRHIRIVGAEQQATAENATAATTQAHVNNPTSAPSAAPAKEKLSGRYRVQAGQQLLVPAWLINGGCGSSSSDPAASSPSQPPSERAALTVSELSDFRSRVLYSDAHLLVFNKPAGLAVHAGSGQPAAARRNLNAMMWALEDAPFTAATTDTTSSAAPVVPAAPQAASSGLRLVHRLDKETSGCLMLARDRHTAELLSDLLAAPSAASSDSSAAAPIYSSAVWNDPAASSSSAFSSSSSSGRSEFVQKRYLAIVHGAPSQPEGAMLSAAENGALCYSSYRVLAVSGSSITASGAAASSADRFSLLELIPHTGRKRQLRLHCHHELGCTIVGEQLYMLGVNAQFGRRSLFPLPTMMLSQMLAKDKEALHYEAENLTPQTVYYALYRKKVVLVGPAPVERLSVPALLLPGETAKIKKPAILFPWSRYIAFGDEEQLKAEITDAEFNSVLRIWVDEINTVVLTETLQEDGVRSLYVQSWATWSAAQQMAPVASKLETKKQAFFNDFNSKLLADMSPHLHAKDVATVRSDTDLPSAELQFMEQRGKVTRKAIESITGLDLSSLTNMQLPKIQICGSGGGYRAMIATLGSLIGLEEFGLLDAVTALTGVSGSTWTMALWYASGKSLVETRAHLAETLSAPFYSNKIFPDLVKSHLKERMAFDQELSPVDVFAWHLDNHLLSGFPVKPEQWHKPRLSEQSFVIADGSRPIPIYTAVCYEHKHYRWLEFTPFEVGIAQDINIFVPTFAFGRKFENGTSTDFAVEPSLALMQATWGSAFCATVDQMMHELGDGLGAESAPLHRLLHTLVYDKLEMSEDRLITPAKFPNMGHGLESLHNHPWREMKHLKVMDAGVHTNLPFPPLLRKERGSDIIIALDQSSAPDILSSVSMDILQKFAEAEKMPWPDCSAMLATDPAKAGTPQEKHSAANGVRCTIIPGDVAKGIPTIVYLPLLRNKNFDEKFCPRENALTKGGFCSTFNFQYTAEQVLQLSGLTRQNIADSVDEIKACIKGVTEAKIVFENSKPKVEPVKPVEPAPPVV